MMTPEIMRALAAKGFSSDQIADIEEIMGAKAATKAAERRAKNAQRMRNVRARAAHGDAQPRTDAHIAHNTLSEDDAQQFWQRYPLKVGKRAAMQALERALKRASLADILAGIDRYKASANPDYYCHPTTWLNADRWLDEPKLQRINKNGKGLAELAHDLAEEYHREFEVDPGRPFDDKRRT